METFIGSAGLLALVKALVDFLKFVRAGNINGWLTLLVVWLGGVGVTILYSFSDFADQFEVLGVTLGTASLATLILFGLGLGSSAVVVNEFKTAIDSSDSATKPPLVSSSTNS